MLLLTLSFSAALIAFLVAFAARSINRALRERETVLSQKDGELAAKDDMMMREIDHRVRNSLNLVYNLMMFQRRRTIDAAARRLLNEAANQVLVVARVHERLYKYGSMEAVELGDYLRDLCRDVASFSLPAEAQAAIQRHSARRGSAGWPDCGRTGHQCGEMRQTHAAVPDRGRGIAGRKGIAGRRRRRLVHRIRATLEVDPAWAGTRFIRTVPLAAARQIKRNDLRQTDQAA